MLTMELLNLHSTPKLQQPRLKVTLLQPPAWQGIFLEQKKLKKKKQITYSYHLTHAPHVFWMKVND